MATLQVVWNDTVIGTLDDPKVDNFFLYGRFVRQSSPETWQELLDTLERDGEVNVELRGEGKPLKASILVEPDEDQLEVRLDPSS